MRGGAGGQHLNPLVQTLLLAQQRLLNDKNTGKRKVVQSACPWADLWVTPAAALAPDSFDPSHVIPSPQAPWGFRTNYKTLLSQPGKA